MFKEYYMWTYRRGQCWVLTVNFEVTEDPLNGFRCHAVEGILTGFFGVRVIEVNAWELILIMVWAAEKSVHLAAAILQTAQRRWRTWVVQISKIGRLMLETTTLTLEYLVVSNIKLTRCPNVGGSEPQRPLVQPPPEAEAEAWHKTHGWRPPGPRPSARKGCQKELPKLETH
ncbi:hypothetical protein K435DRAFT_919315 [Dendrothele bispora CBS 962.96]|uniref:Uncharacterized protein n=1 Tax=Dendrothele bispora (strain CBS 962.96) TaxID=1314807 RepID=A0A4S8LFF2_DENBC|nr:hypothetical protein K435DRAFT_919315 [Dendrothele bispora CBS 962.96]